MAILFTSQSSLTETYLRRCFQPNVVDQSNIPNRFVVLCINTAWTLHSTLFQLALATESSVKIIFSILSFNKTALYANGLRLLSVPVSLILTGTSVLTIALSILSPDTALHAHQSLIGYTQILSSYFDIKTLEQAEIACTGAVDGKLTFAQRSSAMAILSLIRTYPRPEDLYLLTRAVHQYWQPLPHLLTISERLFNEEAYPKLKVQALNYLHFVHP